MYLAEQNSKIIQMNKYDTKEQKSPRYSMKV